MRLGIGIDTGGTYTDAVLYDFDAKTVLAKGKSLTTKGNLSVGIGNALDTLPTELRVLADVISLSTTLATNACVENKGGRAKLILMGTTYEVLDSIHATTKYGLKNEDVLCLQTGSKFDGSVVEHPMWSQVLQEHKEWFEDAQALGIADVNAVHNGAICEKVAKQEVGQTFNVPFVMASELVNNLNMMERGATALLNARLLPVIDEFMVAVTEALSKRDMKIKTMVVRSDGSLMTGNGAVNHPVQTILSGPAASIIGGRDLAECKNSLIVDMGGTTTDISIVKNDVPEMTEGIKIGGYKTQIKGVFIDTIGLGGDSRIAMKDGQLSLETRRVQPLCVAAATCPNIVLDLERLLEDKWANMSPKYEFLYLVRQPENLAQYTERELKLIQTLSDGPVMLGSGIIDVYNMKSERLESEGIIMRCGMTPTDIMHIRGDFARHDKRASVLGAKYLLKALPNYEETEDDLQQLCEDIYQLVCKKMYENIVRVLLINKYPKLFAHGVDEQIQSLIAHSWDEKNTEQFFDSSFIANATLVGIGAPTHIFLPKVAEMLGTTYVIPDHAEVANAVGAIVADIDVSVELKITREYAEEESRSFKVYGKEGNEYFASIQEATDFAKAQTEELVSLEAKNRGALGELTVVTEIIPHTAYSEDGLCIDMGTTVISRASGRL